MIRAGIVSAAFALAVAACVHTDGGAAGVSPCTTPCGMRGPGPCRTLDRAERETTAALERYAGISAAETCRAVRGWTVEIHARDAFDARFCGGVAGWARRPDFCVSGFTHAERRAIELWEEPGVPRSAFPHEVVHVVDYTRDGGMGHCAWKERGILAALKSLGHEDTSEPEESCAADAGR